jgi:hypothetical protein
MDGQTRERGHHPGAVAVLSRDDKTTIKDGGVPTHWAKAKRAQKDTDGRSTLRRGPAGGGGRERHDGTRRALDLGLRLHESSRHLLRHGFIRNFAIIDGAVRMTGARQGHWRDTGETANPVSPISPAAWRRTCCCWCGAG